MRLRGTGTRKGQQRWNHPLCEFAATEWDCNIPLHPHGLSSLPQTGATIKAWQLGRLFVTVSAPAPLRRSLSMNWLGRHHRPLTAAVRPDGDLSHALPFSPLGWRSIWWYSKPSGCAHATPVLPPSAASGQSSTAQLRHRAWPRGADGVPVRTNTGRPYPNSPVISSAQCWALRGEWPSCSRPVPRDHAVTAGRGCAGHPLPLHGDGGLRRPNLSVFWNSSAPTPWSADPIGRHPVSPDGPLPGRRTILPAINNPFMVKSVIHMGPGTLETSMLVVAAISGWSLMRSQGAGVFPVLLPSWRCASCWR